MYKFSVPKRYLTLLVDYPDRNDPDLMHHEVRKVDTILWTDNRISDYKFDDASYPITSLDYFPKVNSFIVERSRKGSGWVCLDRASGHVLGRFSSFNDALDFGKMKEAKREIFSNKITF